MEYIGMKFQQMEAQAWVLQIFKKEKQMHNV